MRYKECIHYFKEILYTEVKNYNEQNDKKKDIITKMNVLEEVIDIIYGENSVNIDLDKIKDNKLALGLLLPIVFGNEETNRINNIILGAIYNHKNSNIKINALARNILTEYNNLKNQFLRLDVELKEKQYDIIQYKRILGNYKYNGIITKEQIDLIESVMEKYDFSIEDQIRVFESVRIHNIKNMYDDPKISYTVINMLETNFEKYDVDGYENFENKKRFSDTINSFYNSIKKSNSIDEYLVFMPSVDDSAYTFEEFCYIYECVINKIIDDLKDGIKDLSEPGVYQDQDLRKVVVQEYNENKYIYNKLKYIYEENKRNYLSQLNEENALNEKDNNMDKSILLYESISNGESTYLERDLKKFPYEYLNKVVELLEKKKSNTLSYKELTEFKATNDILKDYEELRDGQVRIICKHLTDRYYCVVGAFVKKDDNPLKEYYNIAKRGCQTDISTPELLTINMDKALKAEVAIYEYVKKNARKGSR